MSFEESADRAAAGVHAVAHAVEFRAQRRAVANQDQRLEAGEWFEAAGDFVFTVFAGVLKGVGLE